MSLFSKHEKLEQILILDVQSSVVRGSVVLLNGSIQPQVLFTYNANIPWKPHTDSSYLIKVTLHAVTETVEACMRSIHIRPTTENLPKKVDSVHYALSSPWIVSQAKTLRNESTKEVQLTKAYVEKIIADERSKLTAQSTDEVTVIEEKIFDVSVNGYSVNDWIGKSGTRIDVSYTMSVAGTRMIERFKDVCEKVTHRNSIFFHSSLLLQFIGMRLVMPDRHSYGLIHIHGELSDVAIMDANACVFFGSYPMGVRTLLRKISQSTDTDIQAADSLLALYVGGHIDDLHGKSALDAVKAISMGWTSDLKKLLTGQNMPSYIVISAWAHDDFFARAVADTFPSTHVEPLSIENISPHVTFGQHTERRRLTGLYAIALGSIRML